jgi:uncharacterized protein (DUF433 family)
MLVIHPSPTPSAVSLTPDDLAGDLVQLGHPLFGIIWVNPDRMSGTPCFAGTRVPVKSLFDHLEANDSIATFLEDFPPVTHQQVVAVLELSRARILDELVCR